MKMLIEGKLIDKNEKIAVENPFNNEIIDYVPSGDAEDVKKAISAAAKATKSMKEMSSRKLSRIMYDIHQELKEKHQEISKLISLETGKPIRDSRVEMDRSLQTLLMAAEESKRIYGETIPMDAAIAGRTAFGFTIKIPLGVVAAISPFNYPVNLAIHKIAPALAAKNTVVFKPSTKAPLAALKMAEIMGRHLPDGAVNAITGPGGVLGDQLVTSDQVNKVSFTGSVATGLSIARKAGMKKLTLELGGNDPLIVLDDADIDAAVLGAVGGSYLNAGQVCIGVKRLIVQESVADEFTEQLVSRTQKVKTGDPLDPETDMGPLIDEEAALNVEKSVNDAIQKGAQLLCGGKREGAFFQPTVLDHVQVDMELVQRETFGPVSPVIRVENLDEAIKAANSTPYGLQAGVFTQNITNAKKAVREIEAGSVLINKQPTFRTDNMPFGGFKMSGMGKEGVKYAVEDMTRTKMVVIG
ncbi:lactaldehyde dehydrogenase [Methanobacterium formicicum]|jgi:lactaldehyde dehydrogenase|uniref:Lactaldehyde dehydrogenase n=1 Tax=Methanobacterium formicicum TaxID=2162 RepID=A0A090I2A3_METFO|nr:lactaldehyde dehydrogenase [Methanobacterium formicicum]AIS31634.1 lactaldehyde dehydrogenase CofA [Methanobacterium formicicum]MDH2660302.1 lactaldehyde dehydrogenase [Methanobacterium formicicum]CEA13133.1 Lactaldehyde dehydrogenase [Methanobacterium formicicum]CEL25497.1 Lactaldehyde dehydrogenase [Methanobacterium formicicum]